RRAAPARVSPPKPVSAPVPTTTGTTASGSLLTATRIGSWDAAALAPFEQALANAVGPLAKVLVRRAALRCHDAASLVAVLATHIEDADEQEAFLKRAGITSATRR